MSSPTLGTSILPKQEPVNNANPFIKIDLNTEVAGSYGLPYQTAAIHPVKDMFDGFTWAEEPHVTSMPMHLSESQQKERDAGEAQRTIDDSKMPDFVHPMFLGGKMDLSYMPLLKVPRALLPYAFFGDLQQKLTFYAFNTMPYRITRDAVNRRLLLICSKYSPLYDYMFHSFIAVSALDCYYQTVQSGNDAILGLDKNVYLMLGDYHITRSMDSLNREIKVQEDSKKAVSILVTSMLQLVYATASPHQKIASRGYFDLGKSLGMRFAGFSTSFSKCLLFTISCARFYINDYDHSPSAYFPKFLYGLSGTVYPPSSDRIRVLPMNEEDREIIDSMVQRLNKEYNAYQNSVNIANPVGSCRYITLEALAKDPDVKDDPRVDMMDNLAPPDTIVTPTTTIEKDLYAVLTRYVVDIPDRFIDLVEMGDPRALIVVAYDILCLGTKPCEYLPISLFQDEIEYISGRLDQVDNSELWKSWLNPLNIAMYGMSQARK